MSRWPYGCCPGTTNQVCGDFTEPTNPDGGRCRPSSFPIPCSAPDVPNFDPNLRADPNTGEIGGDCWIEYEGGPSVYENASSVDCTSAAQNVAA